MCIWFQRIIDLNLVTEALADSAGVGFDFGGDLAKAYSDSAAQAWIWCGIDSSLDHLRTWNQWFLFSP